MEDSSHIWNLFSSFHSTDFVQKFLLQSYKKNGLANAEILSYDNSYPFIYYLEHGQNYYLLSKKSPISIQPILLFYGMVQLLKGCLLTVNPQYPENSSVLAHGVSTRKRKKKGYEFLNDEVKIQKNGLFPHFSEKMFHVKHLEGDKYSMRSLLLRIPDMSDLFFFHDQYKNNFTIGNIKGEQFTISSSILDDLNMTYERFRLFLQQKLSFVHTLSEIDQHHISLEIDKPLSPVFCSPLTFHFHKQQFCIPSHRDHFNLLPEIMVHYLLLYNLSMICRYETEWWSDLLHSYTGKDYPYITHFLSLTAEKVPYLLLTFLKNLHDKKDWN